MAVLQDQRRGGRGLQQRELGLHAERLREDAGAGLLAAAELVVQHVPDGPLRRPLHVPESRQA
eukprot:10000662-Heterocapsa_arctica.AAC.1